MAQELVLIPKTKYDHLLEQIEGRKIEEKKTQKTDVDVPNDVSKQELEQRGGQSTENTNSDMSQSTPSPPPKTFQGETGIEPPLFIEKPLSDMKFFRRLRGNRSRGNKRMRKQWIDYTF